MATRFWDTNTAGYEDLTAKYVSEWDTVKIGGNQAPGIAEVTASSSRSVDEKKPIGTHGARVTALGYTPAKIDIRIYVWTPAQLDALDKFLAALWPTVAKKVNDSTKGLDISHPALNTHMHIKSVVITDISALQPGNAPGQKMVALKAIELFPPDNRKNGTKTIAFSQAETTRGQEGGSSNYTAANGKAITVTPSNAPPTAPSQSTVDRGPRLQSG
jgi:hypothetical protein